MPEIDHEGLAETLRHINEALADTAAQTGRLAEAVVEGRSDDERVRVRVTGGWRTVTVRLREDIFRSYDLATLGEVVTRAVRDTQQRARAAYERAVEQIETPRLTPTESGLRWIRPE
jgi:DNA-binding protein YbaB